MAQAFLVALLTASFMLIAPRLLRRLRGTYRLWHYSRARTVQQSPGQAVLPPDAATIKQGIASAAIAGGGSAANRLGSSTSDAIARARHFLLDRIRSGEYSLSAVNERGVPQFSHMKGHVFSAPFLIEALGTQLGEAERALLLTRILSEEQQGVWGYSTPGTRHAPQTNAFHVDSDDTAFALLALRQLGVFRPPECLLKFYREEQRLFVTFDNAAPGDLVLQASLENNFRAHPEVNLNIFRVLRGTHLDHLIRPELLLAAQDETGLWPSYYYPSLLYATELAVDVLHGQRDFAQIVRKSLDGVVGLQNHDGSWGTDSDPYETAMAVAALAHGWGHSEAIGKGVDFLLGAIAADGSWKSDTCVWRWNHAHGEHWFGYDHFRSYVTARCVIALCKASST